MMSRREKKLHLKEHLTKHVWLLLEKAVSLCTDVDVTCCNSAWFDYENVKSDILIETQSLVDGLVEVHRELRQIVREQSERITTLERLRAIMGRSDGLCSQMGLRCRWTI